MFFPCVRGAWVLRISYQGVPEIALGVELLNLVQLDVGVLRAGSSAAGDPPVGAGQAGGQVGTSSGRWRLVRGPWLGQDFAVRGLP